MFIEDGFKDCCDDLRDVKFKDGFYDDLDLGVEEWKGDEKEDYGFCVGQKEQMSLATKTIIKFAKIRNDI